MAVQEDGDGVLLAGPGPLLTDRLWARLPRWNGATASPGCLLGACPAPAAEQPEAPAAAGFSADPHPHVCQPPSSLGSQGLHTGARWWFLQACCTTGHFSFLRFFCDKNKGGFFCFVFLPDKVLLGNISCVVMSDGTANLSWALGLKPAGLSLEPLRPGPLNQGRS